MIRQIERALKDGLSIFKLPMATQKYYNKNKGDFEVVAEKGYNMEDIYDLIAFHRFDTDFRKLSSKDKEWVENDAKERGFNESLLESDITDKYYSLIDELYEAKPGPDAYMTGLSDKEKEEKEAKMKKQAEMDDDDPDSYEELPGDEEARESGKVKKSKHTTAYDKKFKKESMHNLKSFDNFISEEKVTEAKAYKLKASEFGGDTHSAAYNVKGETTWRVHSTYAIDQVSGENNPEERDVVFFEAMPINNDIYIKIGGINNLKRSNGATVGNNFSTTIDEWKIDPKGIAKEASEFLTDATHLKWINKKARSEGQTIKWALKDDYSSVIEDLVNKSLGLTESKNSKEIKELEDLLKSIKSNTPAAQGRKAAIQDDIERLKNESVVTEEVVYNSSNTKPEAAKQATKEFGKLLPKANKGVEPYVFAVIKTKARNYRLAIKSGSYVAHEFMSGLRKDGILTTDIVKKAVANVIKMNPEEFNESMVNNQSIFSGIALDFEDFVKEKKSLNEANKGKVHRAAKKGSYPAVIVVVQDGKVIHQEPVSTPDVAPATFNVMQEKYPKALLHLEDNTGKRLFSESIVNEAKDSVLIKKLTDTFDKFKLPRKYEIMMDSIYGAGSKWAVLRKKKEYREGCVIDTLYIDGGSNYEGYIELKDARSGRPISGKNRFAADEIDDAMEAAVKHVDGIKESNNVDRLLSNIDESKQSDELAIAINSAIVDIDDSMSYVDFAQAVGKVIRDEYGTHLYKEFKKEINKSLKESFNELRSTPLSGTMAGSTQSLEDRKYKLKKDVKGARIGDFVNVTLPKGTIIYNLPGGLFADHFSLKSKYTTSYGNGPKWLSQSWGQGVSIRQMPDILDAIEKNSKVLESAITEAKLTRGLKPLLTIGSTITKNAGEDALLDLSDKFDRIDDEYAGTIASWLDMAIELMQDRYAGAATKKLKQFNKACKDVLNGKEVGSAFESVTENRMLRKGQFKFGAKLQYGIEDVNESYGFYGTLTNQFGLDEVNELFLDGFAVLDTNYDFTDQAALYYLNSKAGRWVADQVIEKLIGPKNMSPYYGHLEEIFAEYAKKGQWKKWAKEYDQFAEEDNMEEGLMIRESRSSKDEYYRELLEAEQTTNDQSPLGDGGMETGIKNKAKESGVPVGLLRIIMRRGLAAWKTGHRPGATQAQWGYARVNSFLTKQPGTWGKADSDIAKKVRDGGHDKDL